jgi:hypothetical protein
MIELSFASLTIGMLECWNSGNMGSGLRLGETNGMMGLKKKESKPIKLD